MRKTAAPTTRTQSEPTTELTTSRETEVPRRRYLTENEVEALIKAAASERDRIMILIAYRHGLRVSELINLQWRQVDFDGAHLQVERLKGGEDSVHPLSGREIRSLRKLRRTQPVGSRFVFTTRDGHPMTRQAFDKRLRQAASRAGLEDCHAHLLRHGCGFRLVNMGVDTLSLAAYLGHTNIQNTKRYARMSATRFDGLWRD
jgi:type 1 fimbriae regulatory protein FimB/type 1 fimbriae regulatory protein FimE